jgi:glutamine synthetase
LPPPVDLNLFRAEPEELALLEKLPASLGEALSLASESSFVRGIVPEATLEAFMQNKSGGHDPAFGEI